MRIIAIVVLLTLSAAATAAAATMPTLLPHVRPLTPGAQQMFDEATSRSGIVRKLVADLQDSDVVVYLVDSMLESPRQATGCLTFVSSAAGLRYVLVRIDRWAGAPWTCLATLAHELQHATEVARAPEVQDPLAMAALYRRIGWECERGHFETAEARAIGREVQIQVAGLRREQVQKTASPSNSQTGSRPRAGNQ